MELDPEPYLRITVPASDPYYFIKDLKTFYRKNHGTINPHKKVQKVKEGDFKGTVLPYLIKLSVINEKSKVPQKCFVFVSAGAERNIYGSATLAETQIRAQTGDLERNIPFL